MVLDVVAYDRRQYNVEVQVSREAHFKPRSLCYFARLHGNQMVKAQDYQDVCRSICVCLLGHRPRKLGTSAEKWMHVLRFGKQFGDHELPRELQQEEGVLLASSGRAAGGVYLGAGGAVAEDPAPSRQQRQLAEEAWDDYCREPSLAHYEALRLQLPEDRRAGWRGKCLTALADASLEERIAVLAAMREVARLAAEVDGAGRASLAAVSHFVGERACSAADHPRPAAKLHLAMCVRVVQAGKSRYYPEALSHLESAHVLLLGCGAEWVALAAELAATHRRKQAFVQGLRRLG